MATIKSPVSGFTGVVVGVPFSNGVGKTDQLALLAYFRRHGYRITEADSQADSQPDAPRPSAK